MSQLPYLPSLETGDLAEDVGELFDELAATLRQDQRAGSGECHPTLDVVETDDTIDVTVDVSGVPGEALRVLFRAGVLVVAGEKAAAPAAAPRTFHLVEREFGRFARAVRLPGAFDLPRSQVTLRDGELRIVLRKIGDRRGQAHRLAITTPADRPA